MMVMLKFFILDYMYIPKMEILSGLFLCVFKDLRIEVDVCFIDIGGIVDINV